MQQVSKYDLCHIFRLSTARSFIKSSIYIIFYLLKKLLFHINYISYIHIYYDINEESLFIIINTNK